MCHKKAIGELILKMRGCLQFLIRDDIFTKDINFIKEQLCWGKDLIKIYSDIEPSNFDLVQRSWLRDGKHCFEDLCLVIKFVESEINSI